MKSFFTLVPALFLSFSLFAFPGQSLLTVSSNGKYPVRVVIDSRNYDQRNRNDNDILVRDIRPGYHSIKIYRAIYKWYGNNDNSLQLVYTGNVYVKPGFHLDMTINRFGKVFIDERQMNSTNYQEEDGDWNDGYYTPAMGASEFNQFKQTIGSSNFENTKMAIAKQTVSQNYFTSAQIKEIVELFSFEGSKLDIAKYAYKYCIDKNNYFIVSNALGFSSSKEELAAFLQVSR